MFWTSWECRRMVLICDRRVTECARNRWEHQRRCLLFPSTSENWVIEVFLEVGSELAGCSMRSWLFLIVEFRKGTILVGTYIGLIFVGERFFGLFICPTGTRYALWETFWIPSLIDNNTFFWENKHVRRSQLIKLTRKLLTDSWSRSVRISRLFK